MFLLGEMLTLLSCDASRTVTILRVGNADSSTSISFSCFSLNLSRKLTLEFYCSSWCQSERSFFWFSWLFFFFFNSNVFPLLKVKTDLVGEQSVFFSCHKLAGLVGDWQLKIIQVSVKLLLAVLEQWNYVSWCDILEQLLLLVTNKWAFGVRFILPGHQNSTKLVVCLPFIVGGEKVTFTDSVFSHLGVKIHSQILWKQLSSLTEISRDCFQGCVGWG